MEDNTTILDKIEDNIKEEDKMKENIKEEVPEVKVDPLEVTSNAGELLLKGKSLYF